MYRCIHRSGRFQDTPVFIDRDVYKRQILSRVKHHVIAEGNINTPEKAKRVIELGCYSVVVGSIITRPQLITKSFTDVMATLEK